MSLQKLIEKMPKVIEAANNEWWMLNRQGDKEMKDTGQRITQVGSLPDHITMRVIEAIRADQICKE